MMYVCKEEYVKSILPTCVEGNLLAPIGATPIYTIVKRVQEQPAELTQSSTCYGYSGWRIWKIRHGMEKNW